MTDVTIEIEDTERFQRQVRDGVANPLTVMNIYKGDEQVKGGDSFMTLTVIELLDAVEEILAGEKQIVEYSGGPSYLVFEPQDDKKILVTGCGSIEVAENPTERLSVDTTVEVDKQSWIVELVRTAEEYYDRIVELNPTLEDAESVQRLRRRISDVNQSAKVDE